jgi:hypothetical protein
MAKKDKTGFVATGDAAAQSSGTESPQSTPANQAAKPEVQPPAPASTTPAAQMENAMVQQILERQAVFGF